MNIAIVSFGHVDSTLPLAKYLSEHINVDVYLVFSQQYKYESIIDFKDLPVNNEFVEEDDVKKILGKEILSYLEGKVKVYTFIYENLRIWDARNIVLSYKFTKYLQKRNYDLIHFIGNNLFQPYIFSFLRKIPKVHTIHDFKSHKEEKKNLIQRFRLPERLNLHLAKSHRHKIVHAKCIRDSIYATIKSAKNIHAIYYGPLEIFSKFNPNSQRSLYSSQYILFFGRITEYKGISYLMEAFEKIQGEFGEVKLVIAGSGDIDLIRERVFKNPDVILINEYIKCSELAGLINRSLVVVCPYIDASQSGVVQTAYAFFKPVIATDIGGLSEVVESGVTGILVPVYDSTELAVAIRDLLSDKKKLSKMSENIKYHLKEELNWVHIAKQTISVYSEALRKN